MSCRKRKGTFVSLTGCNVFVNGPTVQGHVHQTVYGSPAYKTAQSAIALPVSGAASGVGVSEYAIAFPFKQGYSYTIQVYASGTTNASGSTNGPTGNVGIGFSNTLPATNTGSQGCDTYAVEPSSNFSSYASQSVSPSWSWLTGLVNNRKMTQNQAYLLVAGFPPSQTQILNYVYVRTITITETAPTVSISPTSVSANCGYPVSQTFTLTDGGVGNISGYTWNIPLGSPNGWTYNGAPATFPITTAANSITLSSACTGSALGNITGTVNSGGVAIASATSTMAVSTGLPPDVAISGTPAVCGFNGTSQFTVSNVSSCSATSITWSFDSPDMAILSNQTGPQTTLTTNFDLSSGSIPDGTGHLSATISGACGTNTISEPVDVLGLSLIGGTYYSEEGAGEVSQTLGLNWFVGNAVPVWEPGFPVDVFVNPSMPGATSRSITYTPGYPIPPSVGAGPAAGAFGFQLIGSETVSFDITANTACGPVTQTFQFSLSGDVFSANAVKVSPNPVVGNKATVSLENSKNTTGSTEKQRLIYAVKLTDLAGRVLKTAEYRSGVSRTDVQFPGVQPGNYFISVFDGKKWNTKLLLMK